MTASTVLSTGLADSQTEVIAHWAAIHQQQTVQLNLDLKIIFWHFELKFVLLNYFFLNKPVRWTFPDWYWKMSSIRSFLFVPKQSSNICSKDKHVFNQVIIFSNLILSQIRRHYLVEFLQLPQRFIDIVFQFCMKWFWLRLTVMKCVVLLISYVYAEYGYQTSMNN